MPTITISVTVDGLSIEPVGHYKTFVVGSGLGHLEGALSFALISASIRFTRDPIRKAHWRSRAIGILNAKDRIERECIGHLVKGQAKAPADFFVQCPTRFGSRCLQSGKHLVWDLNLEQRIANGSALVVTRCAAIGEPCGLHAEHPCQLGKNGRPGLTLPRLVPGKLDARNASAISQILLSEPRSRARFKQACGK